MSVLIGLPCYGGNVTSDTTVGLFNLGKNLARQGVDHGLLAMSNESLITKGRSRIVNFFVNNTEYEYLFFLDADIDFAKEDFMLLWENRNKGILCGAYPMKNLPLEYNFNKKPFGLEDGPLMEITGIGLGFVLIHRKVFVDISKKFGNELKMIPNCKTINGPISEKEKENSYHFFLERKVNGMFLPEDHSFFSRATECGHRVWLDRRIRLGHTGAYTFKG